jgi:hypothetical protein
MGNEAPNWKNLTSPSVAVFLQGYIKSALNTPRNEVMLDGFNGYLALPANR